MERMNLEISEHIGLNISPERIQEGIRQLNGIRHIYERVFSAFGIGDDVNMREYSGVFESGICRFVIILKTHSTEIVKMTSFSPQNQTASGQKTLWYRGLD